MILRIMCFLLLIGCSQGRPTKDFSRRVEYVANYYTEVDHEILNSIIKVGMDSFEVNASWGKPLSVLSILGSKYFDEQWRYSGIDDRYLYFQYGILVYIQ